jgi:Asp-tRNA(Asn)/Glu-tRNA(Gln) amidotransferase B subunit|tara:strand:- start:7 stop:411 length:405 start_codon:yes stop_codon:yes gene_type:complete
MLGILLQNCSSKNVKIIKSPDDLQTFVNVFCEKHKSTDKVIKVCASEFSKDLNIATNKSLLNAKLKLADIVSHSLVSNEVITHKEGKGIVKTYDLNATSTLDEVSISNYRVVHKKIIKENNGWRVMHLLSLKIS